MRSASELRAPTRRVHYGSNRTIGYYGFSSRPLLRSLSIVVPAYNEQARLPETIRRIQDYLSRSEWVFYEIVIVDDGSTDRTVEAATAFSRANPNVKVLRNPGNRGKGYSVCHGMMEAHGEWRLYTDADLSAPIEEIEKLWAAMQRDGSAVAIGSRALDRSLIGVRQPGIRESAGRFFNAVMRTVVGLPFTDTQCGFKLFQGAASDAVFSRQTLDRFGFDVEILYIAKKLGYRISEVPVRWNHVDGSKVGMMTGLHAFFELATVRWNDLTGKYR
jgi:dolichyl-phosphate beta-glucosyltransferase